MKNLKIVSLELKNRIVWDKVKSNKDCLKSTYKKDTHMLDSLYNIFIYNSGDIVVVLITIYQFGTKLVVTKSLLYIFARNLKKLLVKQL